MEQRQIESIKELQSIAIEGMAKLKHVCEQYHIQFYLTYGTLLGAIRHHGFIPWDDDVDIWIPREGYELLKSLPKNVFGPDWCLYTYDNTKGYENIYMKLCSTKTEKRPSPFESGFKYGISIDIFPLDSLRAASDEEAYIAASRIHRRFERLQRVYRTRITTRKGYLGDVLRILFRIQYHTIRLFNSTDAAYKRLERQMIQDANEAEYLVCYCEEYKTVWKHTDIIAPEGNEQRLIFEGSYYTVPNHYDEVLKRMYGDYMKLPPVNKRTTNHLFDAYYL